MEPGALDAVRPDPGPVAVGVDDLEGGVGKSDLARLAASLLGLDFQNAKPLPVLLHPAKAITPTSNHA